MPRPKPRVSIGLSADTVDELDHLVIDSDCQSRSELIAEFIDDGIAAMREDEDVEEDADDEDDDD